LIHNFNNTILDIDETHVLGKTRTLIKTKITG